ncbi:PREDICTED: putative calcium-transporting ATPase 13, plasma membrane-type [Camelina sativa]|uniref:Calcium-transporting ATPase n=1 Tax=Camelina sativa TaxID=90675 RepID=A0ABM0Z8E9_CAMSA|nr:PREDICTED: putative calcium-transporting ATPase 13, plasma membrane-type [Camelina sativa]
MRRNVPDHAEKKKNKVVGVEVLLELPKTLSKPNKKWQLAFIKIYCSRTLLNCAKHAIRKPGLLFPRSLSYTAIDLDHHQKDDHHGDHFKIDTETLNDLVKNKNQEKLESLGGPNGLVSALKTNTRVGINEEADEIERRRLTFGSNTYTRQPSKSLFYFVVEAFKDLTILILLGCATLSLGFGIKEHGVKEGWYDGGSIFVAVFLVVAVSAVSNFRQNRQFDKLSKVSSNIKIDVVRNGRRQEISIFDIVVGDIVCLNIGDQVPADGVFVEGHSLHVDESSMTGESDHVEVSLTGNTFLFSGTKIADGFGKMAVTSVGMNTAWGQMMSHISRDTNEQTPLQSRLDKLTSSIGKVGLLVAFLVLLVLLVRYFTGTTKDESGNRDYNGKKTKSDEIVNAVVKMVAAAVTIIVVAIPEGLPLAVTLTLAYSMKRMMKDQAMVRKLSACETMGSATVICTDKTGTLTLNQMKVTDFWFGLESGKASSVSQKLVELIHQGVGMNTTGSVFKAKSGTEYEFSGSPTEKAILSWAVEELKMDMEEVIGEHNVVHVEAFNSEKKRSGVLMKKKNGEVNVVHWKGAAEKILAMCSTFYDGSGVVREIKEDDMIQFEKIIQSMAAKSLRCIAFAYSEDNKDIKKLKEEKLSLLGIVGIKDPCRPGVKKAVEDCQFAGVNIKMITGDNIFTARAIAVECGILTPEDEVNSEAVVEGEEFRNYSQEERLAKVERIKVMARSSPFDKLLMVKCLKELGHVVAVTGDGTNDAPALKEADIGLSMGIQGTEVAKESSDIVILDDNFASVATVLKWGRCVYNNIQKFIQFQLTVNVAALVINFVAAVSAGEVPLTAVQLLWVNLIMDTLGALALATEKPTNDLMKKRPIGRVAPLITNIMWRNLLAQAFYQISVLLVLQFRGRSIFDVTEKVKNTLIFNTFVLCQVFNEFNARSLEKKNVFKGLHKNRLFIGIIVVTVVLQVVMVEFLKRFANTERLNWGQWGVCIAIAAASWPIGWLVKSVPVPEKHFFSYLKWKKRS